MGFFDRFAVRKSMPSGIAAASSGDTTLSSHSAANGSKEHDSAAHAATPAAIGGVKPRLAAAREKIAAKDLPAAMAIYEELLATSGDRADVLVAISGDLGSNGHVAEIIELIAPRYDADRHGPATGLNLLQAYLAVRNADAAQHVLDILFGLNRPELEERLHGFSNVIAEILVEPSMSSAGPGTASSAAKIGLITISKPIWFYGLESMAAQVLPPKEGRLRRIAFAQLALPGHGNLTGLAPQEPEDELGRLSRAIPLWLAETFYFSPSYSPTAAIGILTPGEGPSRYVNFGAEWTTENLRQLVETTEGGLDYIFSGALRGNAGDYEMILRVWDVKTFRERKTFSARWTPATVESSLGQLHTQIRMFMEWSPASAAFAYTIPSQPRQWLETLGAALGLFLLEKTIVARDQLRQVEPEAMQIGQRAAASEAASLAALTFRSRAARLGYTVTPEPVLARSPLVSQALKLLE